ncbi:MAG: AAA family ATPase [Stenotrophomonas nitritireducens]|uniref:AAA family ATPase n=1 Tax=Stenotrophomonas nitritireducens TaxID=83617 RepID=UPI001AC81EB4|nr:AAA family ATPase [Stenotrophomonas nitritireducens]MBN8791027.1 AAA family ATPase [Stenotrophomonas nitritireducens]MBN8796585.1 AAA family ATPase [Stenotrophomonas nitritireducens]
MASVDVVREKVIERLVHAVDLGNGVLRGDRKHHDETFATAYIDLSDTIVERSRNLAKFQEELLGESFFEGEGNQRWNSYLYFWAGPKSKKDADFQEAKARIEHDRHYARKFVLTEEDLLNRIDDISRSRPKTVVSDDALTRWSEQLRQTSLDVVLEQKPRAQLLRLIENGEAFVPVTPAVPKSRSKTIDPLGTGVLRSLQVANFRTGVRTGPFSFGDVNLIVGQNGSGKTSLLELIEALYCGRISRDPTATFAGIQAKLEMPDGTFKDVKGTTMAATIKARNLAWYGRSDHHASMISEGFIRFNFLDTDAAFRLSKETDVQKIKDDLSRLLVGPETSALWAYLTKLHDDLASSLRSLDERLPSLKKQTELLGAEVKRLQETPSQATSLAKTYRASLTALGAKWDIGDAAEPIKEPDRTRLEALSRGFRHALGILSVSPATAQGLRDRLAVLEGAISELSLLEQRHETLSGDYRSSQARLASCQQAIVSLQQWKKYCEAGAPELAAAIERTGEQIESLRSSLGGLTIGSIPEFAPEYTDRTINAAKEAAETNLSLALAQERSGTESLNQIEQIGQSLQALKGDLHAIAIAIVDRTGDSSHCPVCGTVHEQGDLLRKIEALESPEDPTANDGLRLAIQEAKVRVDRERKVIAAINALVRYATSSGASNSVTVAQLREKLADEHNRLDALLLERDQHRSAEAALGQQGLDFETYGETMEAAASLLDPGKDPFDTSELNRAIKAWEDKLQAEQRDSSDLHEARLENVERAFALVTSVDITVQKTSTTNSYASAMNRMRETVDTSLKFIQAASGQIDVPDSKPFGDIQSAIDEAIASFDRALHAEASDSSARKELGEKSTELQRTTVQVQDTVKRHENLAKAEEVLRRIKLDYSLEDATSDALASIREQVSYIFARIHNPSEYELADFGGDSVLVTRDGKLPRGANQVSTGQRAALALSIFLSLNQSAESAPPIMLIDDPVAHVDDLNALSFFDYLRDVAVSERKQIFFATADTRVAALFQKKFEFLGKDRYKQIMLSR